MDDEAEGFSKRKYETMNEKRRRMGEKKKKLEKNKQRAKIVKKVTKPAISKGGKK